MREFLIASHGIDLVDAYVGPGDVLTGASDQIFAIPTLVRKLPQPVRKIIGNLSDVNRELVGLDLRPASGSLADDR